MNEPTIDAIDFDGDMSAAARAVAEAASLIETSQRDIRGLDEVNAAGLEVLSAWRSAAHSASRALQRYLYSRGQ